MVGSCLFTFRRGKPQLLAVRLSTLRGGREQWGCRGRCVSRNRACRRAALGEQDRRATKSCGSCGRSHPCARPLGCRRALLDCVLPRRRSRSSGKPAVRSSMSYPRLGAPRRRRPRGRFRLSTNEWSCPASSPARSCPAALRIARSYPAALVVRRSCPAALGVRRSCPVALGVLHQPRPCWSGLLPLGWNGLRYRASRLRYPRRPLS